MDLGDGTVRVTDVLLILVLTAALNIENQNHMFSELLFLRFAEVG